MWECRSAYLVYCRSAFRVLRAASLLIKFNPLVAINIGEKTFYTTSESCRNTIDTVSLVRSEYVCNPSNTCPRCPLQAVHINTSAVRVCISKQHPEYLKFRKRRYTCRSMLANASKVKLMRRFVKSSVSCSSKCRLSSECLLYFQAKDLVPFFLS
jgi:hypothetical protein